MLGLLNKLGGFNPSSLLDPGGLRINGRDPADLETPILAQAKVKNQPAGPDEPGGLKPGQRSLVNFAGEISARLQNANQDSPEAALLLADNLAATADEIKKEFGQAKANEFMSRVLTATDAGVNEKNLTFAISGFFRQLASESKNDAARPEKLENMKNFLNKGLDLTLDSRGVTQMIEDGDQPGLSYALNKFFGTRADISEDGQGAEVKAFNSGFERVYMRVQAGSPETYESGLFFLRHNLGTIKDISEETVNQVSSFLRNQIGDDDLADYLEQESGQDFLGATTISIAVVAREYGRKAAEEYVDFLNKNVAPAISSASGAWVLKGWELEADCSAQVRPEPPRPGTDVWVSGGGVGRPENNQADSKKAPEQSANKTVEVDMNELYAIYKKAVAAVVSVPEGDNLNNPVGNLVDVQA